MQFTIAAQAKMSVNKLRTHKAFAQSDRIQRFLVFAQESPQLMWRMVADSAVDLLIRNETLQYSVNLGHQLSVFNFGPGK